MNKYIAIALLPFVLQGTIYGEDAYKDIDQLLMPELLFAQTIVGKNVSLELDQILPALILYGKTNLAQSSVADRCLYRMQSVFSQYEYKANQNKSTWENIYQFFGVNTNKVPKEVAKEIDSARQKIRDATLTLIKHFVSSPPITESISPLTNKSSSDVYYRTYDEELKVLKKDSTVNLSTPERYSIYPTNTTTTHTFLALEYRGALPTYGNISYIRGDKDQFDKIFYGPATIISDPTSPLGFSMAEYKA